MALNQNINVFSREFWMQQWQSNRANDTHRVHKGFSTPEYWDRAASNYDTNSREIASRKIEKTVALFKKNNLLPEEASVLEIGCGTGTLAVALAKAGCLVTALDFSEKMIDRCRKEIPPDLESRITLHLKDWHDINIVDMKWQNRFDLVIAFMSPAVSTPDMLFKMMETSKKGCAIRSWAARRKHAILDALWAEIMEKPLSDNPKSFLYKINLLFAMGYFPEITFDTVRWEESVTVESELENQLSFFKTVSDKSEGELKKIIDGYLKPIAENGRIIRQHRGITGTALWHVA